MIVKLWTVFLCASTLSWQTVSGIGCYVCMSVNGSNEQCEDEFRADPEVYHDTCMAVWKGRTGLFPASSCYKLKASAGNYTVMVRNCALDSGGPTNDVEIGTLNHCGWAREINYNGTVMKGCLMTCDGDGCNAASTISGLRYLHLPALMAAVAWLRRLIPS